MARPSHREKIIAEGLRVVHERGYAGASVRDIVRAAGVPQGSFTNHFASKEAFGLEVLNLYYADSRQIIAETLANQALAPLARLRAYVDSTIERGRCDGMKSGCLFGNFSAEIAGQSEALRARLAEILEEVRQAIVACLQAAVAAGEIAPAAPVDRLASVIQSGLQGAVLIAKAQRSTAPIEAFRDQLFETLLPRPQGR
jgi:TetR/AcrR family transcriptional repressor of nem operon